MSNRREDFAIDNRLIDEYAPRIGVYGVAVFSLIARYADEDGDNSSPSLSTIISRLGIGRTKAVETIQLLIDIGLIEKQRGWMPEIAKGYVRKKAPQTMMMGAYTTTGRMTKQCEWCTGSTFILHNHHFPTPRSEGGTETVAICPNCHAEYHCLTNDSYRLLLPERDGHE